eukprot:206014-Amphidinium_carterae.2
MVMLVYMWMHSSSACTEDVMHVQDAYTCTCVAVCTHLYQEVKRILNKVTSATDSVAITSPYAASRHNFKMQVAMASDVCKTLRLLASLQ